MKYIILPLMAFVLTFLVLTRVLKGSLASLALDHPNERSLHTAPVPRTGGLVMMGGILFGWIMLGQLWLLPIAGCVLFTMLISLADDIRGVTPGWRLLAHFLTAGAFVAFGLSTEVNGLWLLLMVIAIVWMTNLYNFMDGSDGLAGGMALFGFGGYAAAAWLGNDIEFAVAMLCIVAAALAFLRFNFYPARIFMGDVGSVPLGFMAAAFGLLGWQREAWALWFPILVFSPFIIDATVTLFKRLLGRENVWQAHRSHYYQRLVQMGLGHRTTAIVEYCLMLAVGLGALWLMHRPMSYLLVGLAVWGCLFFALALWIDRLWRTYTSTLHVIDDVE